MNARSTFNADLSATHSLEIEVALTGTYVPGYPERGPTYDCGGTPAEPAMVEDLDIADIGAMVRIPGKLEWKTVSLLDGVDRKSQAYQQIVANLLKVIRDEAEEALMAEAA